MRPETFKAALFRDKGHVDVVDLPYPACGDDEIIVRNLMAGVCGSDISSYRNGGDAHMVWKDHEFGHEMISEVIEMGKDVTGLAIGDHVFPNMGHALRDRRRMSTVGGFSEVIRIPQCEVGYSLFKVDNDIPVKVAVLVEPFVIGSRGARNCKPGPDRSAIVFGAGIIGMAAAIMLQYYGCPKVMIVDISEKRLANARQFGLITCNPATEDLQAKAFAIFGTKPSHLGERCGADCYLDAMGVAAATDGFKLLAPREARLVVVGAHHQPVEWNLRQLSLMNWEIAGCGVTPIEEVMVDILALMRSGRHDLASLVSHEYPVDRISEALVMGGNAGEAQKVCIAYT